MAFDLSKWAWLIPIVKFLIQLLEQGGTVPGLSDEKKDTFLASLKEVDDTLGKA